MSNKVGLVDKVARILCGLGCQGAMEAVQRRKGDSKPSR
jgi:hypothetical protein